MIQVSAKDFLNACANTGFEYGAVENQWVPAHLRMVPTFQPTIHRDTGRHSETQADTVTQHIGRAKHRQGQSDTQQGQRETAVTERPLSARKMASQRGRLSDCTSNGWFCRT